MVASTRRRSPRVSSRIDPRDWSVARALLNLDRKAADPRFLGDIDLLVVERPTDFDPRGAIEVARAVISATAR